MAVKTAEILKNLNQIIITTGAIEKTFGLDSVYVNKVSEDLNIVYRDGVTMTTAQLKEMQKFLKIALSLGYTGCAEFGVFDCLHYGKVQRVAMWAYKKQPTKKSRYYEECIHHIFADGVDYWDARNKDGKWVLNTKDGCRFTLAEVEEFVRE